MDWFAAHCAGILRGSLSRANDNIQLIWIKLMAMANEAKDPLSGRLEFAKGQPYDLTYISTICGKSITEIRAALHSFINDVSSDGTPRVTVEEDGTVILNNWTKYQPRDRGKIKNNGEVRKLAIEKQRKSRKSLEASIDGLRHSVNESIASSKVLSRNIKNMESN